MHNPWLVGAAGLLGGAAAAVLAVLRWTSVEVWPAHAARANKKVAIPFARLSRMPLFGRVRTPDGSYLDTAGTVVVTAVGNSLGHLGIPDGSRLVARRLEGKEPIEPGDLVVVNAEARGSNVGRRLRVVDEVAGGTITFKSDPDGRPHKARPVDSLEAKVTHLLT